MHRPLIALGLCFLLVLAGCGATSSTTTDTPQPSTPAATTPTLNTESPASTPKPTPTPTATTTPTPTADDLAAEDGPWLGEPITVSIPKAASDDFRADTLDAMRWWENNSQYLSYTPEFQLVDSQRESDIHIETVDRIAQCGIHSSEKTSGCAPVFSPERPAPEQATIRIETDTHEEVRPYVLRHELGHVLGLSHQATPGIMQSKAEFFLPNIDERENPWATSTLYVYVDLSDYGGSSERFTDQVDHALAYFEDGADGTMEYDIEFKRTETRSKADIVIRGAAFPDRETAATFGYYQQSVDADPEAEWYVNQTIEVTERADTSAVGWYVGWALAPTLGYDTRPETLRSEREYHHRRSAWWR